MARWKARGRLPISANWTFFRQISRLRRCERIFVEIVLFEKGVSLLAQISGEGGRPLLTFGVRKLESLGYHVALFVWSYV